MPTTQPQKVLVLSESDFSKIGELIHDFLYSPEECPRKDGARKKSMQIFNSVNSAEDIHNLFVVYEDRKFVLKNLKNHDDSTSSY